MSVNKDMLNEQLLDEFALSALASSRGTSNNHAESVCKNATQMRKLGVIESAALQHSTHCLEEEAEAAELVFTSELRRSHM